MKQSGKTEAYRKIAALLEEQEVLMAEHTAEAASMVAKTTTSRLDEAAARLDAVYQRHQEIASKIKRIRDLIKSETPD